MRAWILGLFAAIVVHGFILLFGGLLFPRHEAEDAKVVREVDLISEEARDEEKKDAEQQEPAPEQAEEAAEEPMEAEVNRPPEAAPDPAASVTDAAPALEALSLDALEGMLSGSAGGEAGDFAESASLASGGRIGGTGAPGAGAEAERAVEEIFSMAELDQRPRPLAQASPVYPVELRKRKVEGVVYVLFVVDDGGKVVDPKVERATDPGFERPAIEAVRQWRFEPATRAGKRVAVRMRIPIRFSAES
ncbi:MAG TPA: energy transducer TonB [Candidatus Polarisedimenticolaceae bacterium]